MTLTEAATFTKKAVLFGIVFFIFITIAVLGVQAYLNAQKAKIKPPEEKPTLEFGLLPKPNLSPTLTNSSSFNYTLNTPTGGLESADKPFPKLIRVYYIPKLGTTLLARDRAIDLAKAFKFTQGPDLITPTNLKFTDQNGGAFTYDLETSNFKYTRNETSPSPQPSDQNQDPSQPQDQETPLADEAQLIKDLQSYLDSFHLLKAQLIDSTGRAEYNNQKPQDSKYAIVSLWQTNIDELPVITSNFTQGLIRSTITKAVDEDQHFLTLDYNYWEVDTQSFATYPLKDVKVAYEQLQKGQASVVIQPESPQISITKVYLAYLISKDYSKYLQPVYVFQGENNSFTALVSAIPEDNLEK